MKKPKRILVGLKTFENTVELTALACRLSSRGASLVLVHVIELPDNTALDAEVPDLENAYGGMIEPFLFFKRSNRVNVAADRVLHIIGSAVA